MTHATASLPRLDTTTVEHFEFCHRVDNDLEKLRMEFQRGRAAVLTDVFAGRESAAINDGRAFLEFVDSARGPDPMPDELWPWCKANLKWMPGLFKSRAWMDAMQRITDVGVEAITSDDELMERDLFKPHDGVSLFFGFTDECFATNNSDGIEISLIGDVLVPGTFIAISEDAVALQWRLSLH